MFLPVDILRRNPLSCNIRWNICVDPSLMQWSYILFITHIHISSILHKYRHQIPYFVCDHNDKCCTAIMFLPVDILRRNQLSGYIQWNVCVDHSLMQWSSNQFVTHIHISSMLYKYRHQIPSFVCDHQVKSCTAIAILQVNILR